MKNNYVFLVVIILAIIAIGYILLQQYPTVSNNSTFCNQDSDCVYISGCDFCQNVNYFNSHPKIPCPLKINPTGNSCICQNNNCVITTTVTTTTSPPIYPIQILSVQSIPANPKVGDTLNFNVTVKNVGSVPIVYGLGAINSLSVSYSPSGFFNTTSTGVCSNYAAQVNLQSNQIISLTLGCPIAYYPLIKSGTLTGSLTFSYGYESNNMNSSISTLYTVNVS
jgi:hypothetical protein